MELITNIIFCGDCLIKLREIPSDSIDLIYIDPPFSSNRNYVSFWQEQEKRHFEDRFENVSAYIDYMKPRIKELHRVLKPTGSFYYHCDWHASHYIKGLLDTQFDYVNFHNEIIWKRATMSGAKAVGKQMGRNHDVIFWYSKGNKWVYNTQYISYSEDYINKKFIYIEPNGRRYRLQPKGTRSDKAIMEFRRQGRIVESKTGYIQIKFYLDEMPGVALDDVWVDIKDIRTIQSDEKLGYPTQKPVALIERIIKASSNENDIILDAFCGCGTTLLAAQKLGRRWIGIDISPTSCRIMVKRLNDTFRLKEGQDFWVRDLPKTIEELRVYPAFEFQNWAINALGGVPNKVRVRDKGIDGKLYPIEDIQKEKKKGIDLFGEIDRYIPIQVKRTDQVGRPDIENFEVAMKRDGRNKGIFIGFDFSRDALKEIRRVEREEGLIIEPKTVSQIIENKLDESLL